MKAGEIFSVPVFKSTWHLANGLILMWSNWQVTMIALYEVCTLHLPCLHYVMILQIAQVHWLSLHNKNYMHWICTDECLLHFTHRCYLKMEQPEPHGQDGDKIIKLHELYILRYMFHQIKPALVPTPFRLCHIFSESVLSSLKAWLYPSLNVYVHRIWLQKWQSEFIISTEFSVLAGWVKSEILLIQELHSDAHFKRDCSWPHEGRPHYH